MEGILKSDIFFVVTTIAIVIVAIVFVAALVYVILILRDIKRVSSRVREESKNISEDISSLRKNVKTEGVKLAHFSDFFAKIFKRNTGRRKSKVKK